MVLTRQQEKAIFAKFNNSGLSSNDLKIGSTEKTVLPKKIKPIQKSTVPYETANRLFQDFFFCFFHCQTCIN